jgi:methyl-accepting chemotaxis protein
MKPQDSYLRSINTSFLILLAMHVPVVCGVAMYFGTGLALAAGFGLLFLSGPALLYYSNRESKLTSVALGVASMCFSALLIHLSRGMAEMHFHIFTMLALMIAFRFPWPLVASAASIAVHHVRSLFGCPTVFSAIPRHSALFCCTLFS